MLEILLHYHYPRLLILSCHILITKPILILHKYIDNISSDSFKIDIDLLWLHINK